MQPLEIACLNNGLTNKVICERTGLYKTDVQEMLEGKVALSKKLIALLLDSKINTKTMAGIKPTRFF